MAVKHNLFMDIERFTNTTVERDGKSRRVTLHDTEVFHLDANRATLTLRHGGHKTATTKRRINEALDATGFDDWTVYQKHGDWYVENPKGIHGWGTGAFRFAFDGSPLDLS